MLLVFAFLNESVSLETEIDTPNGSSVHSRGYFERCADDECSRRFSWHLKDSYYLWLELWVVIAVINNDGLAPRLGMWQVWSLSCLVWHSCVTGVGVQSSKCLGAHRERSISDAFLIQEQELGGSGQGSFLQLWKLLLANRLNGRAPGGPVEQNNHVH